MQRLSSNKAGDNFGTSTELSTGAGVPVKLLLFALSQTGSSPPWFPAS